MPRRSPKTNRRFYRVEGGRRRRHHLSRWILGSIGVTGAIWVLFFGETGWLRVRAEEHAVQALREESAQLQARTLELQQQVTEIQRPASPLLEKVARERYLMKRKGETVIHVLDASEDAPRLDKETRRN